MDKALLYVQGSGDLSNLIRRRRKALSLSREELAALAGVSRAMVIRLEDNQVANPGLGNVSSILSTLGLSLEIKEAVGWEPHPMITEKARRQRRKTTATEG
ncbi:helix-turn-helix domain-containing protein [Marinimicrobium sp. ABcell2]|uniref:helix-turn-helix domain-containing protein n=1 Tax=Marinimicrobium sp. ABcell2 TaxID=3069751 RepID=UPI0027B0D9A0|nr:helix-turn-helix domain-containing protein [Marinimicrobium sp. ABcell2]MDQ2077558.1 helix-turn-helix domain-containing protein [Marinimicrobium sp. ABcell2]